MKLLAEIRPVVADVPLWRAGPDKDGGYLMPDDLEGVVGCISPGVSTEIGFDIAIADRNIPVLLADASVNGLPGYHPNLRFVKKHVSDRSTATTATLLELSRDLPPAGDLILQMDIEHDEYVVLPTLTDDLLQRFRVMVIEFHSIDKMLSRRDIDGFEQLIKRLRRQHEVVHLHPNNHRRVISVRGVPIPQTLEMTFYRRDRMRGSVFPRAVLPNSLDRPNLPTRADLTLAWMNQLQA